MDQLLYGLSINTNHGQVHSRETVPSDLLLPGGRGASAGLKQVQEGDEERVFTAHRLIN
jgi:hypothetical protein